MAACRRAQLELTKNGRSIKCPILFMSSNRSMKPETQWRDEYTEGKLYRKSFIYSNIFILADLVLNVENIRREAGMLGQNVTIYFIENAVHDIFLSKKPVRENAFKRMFRWLENLEREWNEDSS